jgi:hypothetical protein
MRKMGGKRTKAALRRRYCVADIGMAQLKQSRDKVLAPVNVAAE